jgi:hypothetical protein
MSGGGTPGKGSLKSFPVPSAVEDEERDAVDEEIHRDEDVSIKVTQSPGFLCHIEATAAFRMPARTLFKQVITHPDNAAIFRHMDKCVYRRVLQDDGRGRRKVKVAHEASWRFLLLHGKFTTKLVVDEDDRNLVMDFQLDPEGGASGIMRKFRGRWQIRPHPRDPEHASLSTLDQDLALGIYMPPPFDRILKRISCNQVKPIFEDVKREADKVNRGKPTLKPWDEVGLHSIGAEDDLQHLQQADAAAVAMAGLKMADSDAPPEGADAGEAGQPAAAAGEADQPADAAGHKAAAEALEPADASPAGSGAALPPSS